MANTIQFKRRIGGAAGAPTGAAKEGEVAFNLPGAAGATTKPDMYIYDGTGWRHVNPTASVQPQSITFPTAANIGAAYQAWSAAASTNKITGDVVIATFGSPPTSYLLTNPALPLQSASWTALGGATHFASQVDAHTGTDTTGAINPATLRGESTIVSAGAADEGKLTRLNTTGKLDPSVLPAMPSEVKGAVDVTIAPPAPGPGVPVYKSGDIVFANKDGTVLAASWPLAPGSATTVKSGDSLIFDGTSWHVIPNSVDLSAYVPLAGTNLMSGNIVWVALPAGSTTPVIAIDLKGRLIDNGVVDAGTY